MTAYSDQKSCSFLFCSFDIGHVVSWPTSVARVAAMCIGVEVGVRLNDRIRDKLSFSFPSGGWRCELSGCRSRDSSKSRLFIGDFL